MRVEVLGCKGGVLFILFCKLNTAFPLEFVKKVRLPRKHLLHKLIQNKLTSSSCIKIIYNAAELCFY